jgi:beta-lactamase regulating signal transducer with metallopeptidase domain
MNTVAEAWSTYAWTMLWQSSVVMLGVWLAWLLCWKRSAALRYMLLCLVLVKFVLPTSFHSVTGLGHWYRVFTENAAATVLVPLDMEASAVDLRTIGTGVMPVMTAQSPAIAVVTPDPKISLISALFVTWLSIVALLLMALAGHGLRTRKCFRGARKVDKAEILELLGECSKEMGIKRRINVYGLSNLHSPVLTGLLRPRIVMAETTLSFPNEQLRPILFHELAHVKRWDLAVSLLQIGLQMLWFFHPGLWVTNWLIRREREKACDDLVLTHIDGDRRNYANSILAVLKNSTPPSFVALGLVGIAKNGGALKMRIKRILDEGQVKAVRIGVTGCVVVFTVAAILLPTAAGEKPETESAANGDQSALVEEIRVETNTRDFNQPDGTITKIYSQITFRGEHEIHALTRITDRLDLPDLQAEKFLHEGATVLTISWEGKEIMYDIADHRVGVMMKDTDSDGSVDLIYLVKFDKPVEVFKRGSEGYFVPGGTRDMEHAMREFEIEMGVARK